MPGETFRTGIGFDAHRFGGRGSLILGGVEIKHSARLAGHSDADVLCHAVCDALFGAAGLGDLGSYFPESDPALAGVSSLLILGKAVAILAQAGWRLVNADATVIAEAPQIAPHRQAMAGAIAAALGVEPEAVSIKATTTDMMGFTGRGEGIAALATVLISPAT